jgi:hypothetical protein
MRQDDVLRVSKCHTSGLALGDGGRSCAPWSSQFFGEYLRVELLFRSFDRSFHPKRALFDPARLG